MACPCGRYPHAGAFRLGGNVEQAWAFGLDRILAAISAVRDGRGE